MTSRDTHSIRSTEKFRRAEFRHNPYVGTFHRTSGGSSSISSSYLPINSPHVGTFRHAPSAGLKEVIKEDKPIRRNFISNIQISQRRCHVNVMALKNIPLSLFTPSSQDSGAGDTPVCAICLDPFKDGDELRNLNCSHCFHKNCVDIWLLGTLSADLQLNGTCPTCRQKAASSPKKTPSNRGQLSSPLRVSVAPSHTIEDQNDEPDTGSAFDILSPLSPVWQRNVVGRNDELHVDIPELTCLQIGAFLVDGVSPMVAAGAAVPMRSGLESITSLNSFQVVNLDDDTASLSSLSDSVFSDCGVPCMQQRFSD